MEKSSFIFLFSGVFIHAQADGLITVDYNIQPVYGYRADGTPGRIVEIKLKGEKLQDDCLIDVVTKGCKEKTVLH